VSVEASPSRPTSSNSTMHAFANSWNSEMQQFCIFRLGTQESRDIKVDREVVGCRREGASILSAASFEVAQSRNSKVKSVKSKVRKVEGLKTYVGVLLIVKRGPLL